MPLGRYPVLQFKTLQPSAAASATISFDRPVSPGSAVMVCCNTNTQYTYVSSVSDAVGNTYTASDILNVNTTGVDLNLYYAKNVTNGTGTITVNFSATPNPPDIAILEVAGLTKVTTNNYTSGNLEAALGSALSGGASVIYVNQYGQCTPFPSSNDFIINVGSGMNGSTVGYAPWTCIAVGSLNVTYKLSGPPGSTLPSYTYIGSIDYSTYLGYTLAFLTVAPKVPVNRVLRPRPFAPGQAR